MTRRNVTLAWLTILAGAIFCGAARFSARAESFSIGTNDFILDGEPYLIRCGEIHFARIPREYWANRLRMAHAMGLNTVCAYLFWNLHEPSPGQFDFMGNADAAEFCRLAQAEGLKVILRPGPYSCAEWDFGGLPWWLLKIPGIKVRTEDPRYLSACQAYLKEVGRQLAPLQITHGGPIIMVQVENEYGSFGNDRQYIGLIRDDLKAAGFDVPLFTCDGPVQLKKDTRSDLFCVVNIDGNPEKQLKSLRAIRPQGPLMVGEYYPGWFDSWGGSHHTGDNARVISELSWMLAHNVSFSMYMAHGGTSFGFDAGANYFPPFSPQTTSYDYDAPIGEAGWDTPKFHALRELFLQHLAPGETLPEVPARNPVITIPPFPLDQCALLFASLPVPKADLHPQPMEMYDQAHGAILYRTQLPAGGAAQLEITKLHDYGQVFLNGQKIATLDRRLNQNAVQLPSRSVAATMDLLVEAFGHVNYGHEMGDFKGITQRVELESGGTTNELNGWQVFNLPLDQTELTALKFADGATNVPAFYRASFELERTGDTFLDLSTWGKGFVWVNGHNLGRYWSIGPQQTLYCPAPWLNNGRNEIIIYESTGARRHVVEGLAMPILNQTGPSSGTNAAAMKPAPDSKDIRQ